jgi:hypothetical protein
MDEKFIKYITNLREEVKREPKNDKESGFQMAVVLIYGHLKNSKKLKE